MLLDLAPGDRLPDGRAVTADDVDVASRVRASAGAKSTEAVLPVVSPADAQVRVRLLEKVGVTG
ncbi:hypothetical protein [Streptomyces montanus]|uniref:hypothetical protein n=1 Tax=Streptomyces montanus TaxID=2580423 RepID=UPI001BB189ED|nr:hypothetical protein [Streptomyces montanus]